MTSARSQLGGVRLAGSSSGRSAKSGGGNGGGIKGANGSGHANREGDEAGDDRRLRAIHGECIRGGGSAIGEIQEEDEGTRWGSVYVCVCVCVWPSEEGAREGGRRLYVGSVCMSEALCTLGRNDGKNGAAGPLCVWFLAATGRRHKRVPGCRVVRRVLDASGAFWLQRRRGGRGGRRGSVG